VTGGLPSVDVHCTPSCFRASRSGCIGLFFKLESPVSVIVLSEREAIAVEILIVVPEFDASISKVCGFIFSLPSTVTMEPLVSIFAPNDLHALIVASVSLESRTFPSVLFPLASEARKIAR